MDVMSSPCAEGELPTAYSEYKHFPARARPERKSHINYQLRAAAKRYALSGEDLRDRFPALAEVPKDQLRPKVEGLLSSENTNNQLWKWSRAANNRGATHATVKSTRLSRGSDEEEGRRLARSSAPLPVDRFRRRPSLEREDAFRDESTSKRHVQLKRRTTSDDAQIAELYQMGLLYDTEADDRAQGQDDFDLNSIRHEQPIYPIRVAKRARGRYSSEKPLDALGPLHLDLSFSDIGNDEIVARLMSAASPASLSGSSEEGDSQSSNEASPRSFAPLRVVYELSDSGDSQASIDVDTSQPPDLILDEYDCFDDSELEVGDEDVPTQREVDGMELDGDEGTWVVLGDTGS